MGFYENAGNVKEYNTENIRKTFIPIDSVFVFKDLRAHREFTLKCRTSEVGSCEKCFFKHCAPITCPLCMFIERRDERSVIFTTYNPTVNKY